MKFIYKKDKNKKKFFDKIKKNLSFENSIIADKQEEKNYFHVYTIIFIIVCLFVLAWYIFAKRTLIWKNDGWWQHYKALIYYAKYLRSIVRNFISTHQIIIPNWSYYIGEGSDILQTLHYYVIGDPFSILSVFVPTRLMYLFYGLMIVLRTYLSGFAFSKLCIKTGHKNKYGILAGTLIYVFSAWCLWNFNKHPYFLNPMLYFPLIILGVEKIIKNEKPYLLIFSVFISALSNFYFFYMIALCTIIYTITRLIVLYKKDIKAIILQLLKIGIYSLIGTMFASIIIIPIFMTFVNDNRMDSGIALNILYPLKYYSKLPSILISNEVEYWTRIGLVGPIILSTLLVFKKKNKLFSSLFIICFIILLIPLFGQALNGFSYMCNRWCWAYILLSAYSFSYIWDNLLELNAEDWKYLFKGTIIYLVICFIFEYSRSEQVYLAIFMSVLFLIVIYISKEYKKINMHKSEVLIGIIVLNIIMNATFLNSSSLSDYAKDAYEIKDVHENLYVDENSVIKEIAKKEKAKINKIRYSGHNLDKNSSMLSNLSSTQYYWSLSNPKINEYRNSLELCNELTFSYENYDDRTFLTTLASVMYYVIPDSDESAIPYGFEYIDTIDVNASKESKIKEQMKKDLGLKELSDSQIKTIQDRNGRKYKIFKNKYYLPLTYTYSNYIDKESWENNYNAVQKQEIMMNAVVLESETESIKKQNEELKSTEIPYNLICNGNEISLQNGNEIVVTSANSSITLELQEYKPKTSELYVSIEGLNFDASNKIKLYSDNKKYDPLDLYNKTIWNDLSFSNKEIFLKEGLYWTEPEWTNLTVTASNERMRNVKFLTKSNSWYNNKHNYTINLGYINEEITSIEINFEKTGVYSFDSLKIYSQSMEDYKKYTNELKKDCLRNIQLESNRITGNINLKTPKILVFSIPYSKGWKAKVDGEEKELLQANIYHMGLELKEGEHQIELTYETPYLKIGGLISVISIISYGIFEIIHKYKGEKINVNTTNKKME